MSNRRKTEFSKWSLLFIASPEPRTLTPQRELQFATDFPIPKCDLQQTLHKSEILDKNRYATEALSKHERQDKSQTARNES
jgi:hypothetical protein